MPGLTAVLLLTIATSTDPAVTPDREIENVAAFARLFGVVRYFYPSDAAATLDWNRFAVHGVGRVRPARDAAALRSALGALALPLGPGIEISARRPAASVAGAPDPSLVAWRYVGPGLGPRAGPSPYGRMRTHRPDTSSIDGFVNLMQTVPADDLRGKTVRLRAQVRAAASDEGGAAVWLRVDRPGGRTGFFDNMEDRLVREGPWRQYAVEGAVADDATNVAFGVMALGAVVADFDAVELAVKTASDTWRPLAIKDAGFEAAAEATDSGWVRAGTSKAALVSRLSESAPEGRQFLRITPPPPATGAEPLFEGAVPVSGAHVDVDLGSGLWARVPLVLGDAQAGADARRSVTLGALRTALSSKTPVDPPDLDQRLADVIVVWNVFRHFYPYWPEVGVDWDARLRPHLQDARTASSRADQRAALRRLVADARDGHGFVWDARRDTGWLPVELGVIEGHLVILASTDPAAPVGAVVTAIDGVAATERLTRTMSLVSGSTQWRTSRAAAELTAGVNGSTATLVLDSGPGPREVGLRYGAETVSQKHPAPVSELEPALWYVDLTQAKMADVTPALEKLAAARGVIFDVRGYPTDAGAGILPHLLEKPEDDHWMHVARLIGPFGEAVGWQSHSWDLRPEPPRLEGRIVFLTDARAISYAESVMGYVKDRKLATIVGGATAGTNGNVASFRLPSGFRVGFTGMRVTGHDGKTPHHLAGVKPDVAAEPTIAGLRAGRDEVLERALALLRARDPAP